MIPRRRRIVLTKQIFEIETGKLLVTNFSGKSFLLDFGLVVVVIVFVCFFCLF